MSNASLDTLNEEDKLLKSNNQILGNSLISPINRGDFLQCGDLRGSTKTTPHGKRGFTKKKRLHKIFLQVQEIVELHMFAFQQNHLGINHSRPSIDFENKENMFII